jgi:HK97 family phage major capsid protein
MKTLKMLLESKGISNEAFEGMDANEKAGLFNELNDLNAKAFAELKAAEGENSKAISKMNEELLSIKDEQLKELKAALKEQGVTLAKYTAEEGKASNKTLASVLKDNEEALKVLKNSSSSAHNVKMELKAVGDMGLATNVTGEIPQAERLAGYGDTPSRRVRLLDVVSRGTIGSNLVSWVYKANEEGAAGQTAEGATKNQIDFEVLEGSQKVEKTTAYITVTDEMLEDISFMETAIRTELQRELLKAVETQVYSGSGVSPQLNGIRTVASAFAAGSFALAIDNANEVDVLTVAANQIDLAQEGSASANYIFMHPSDVTALKMVKVSSTDKRYVERLALIGGSLSLDGIPIVPTTLVTQGEYLIGDFSKAFVLDKQAISIEIGYNADNFVKNYKTIRAEWRGVCFVQNNDRSAFVAGVFATDKGALETI